MTKQLPIQTTDTKQIVDITDHILDQLETIDSTSGLCSIFIKHTTAALTTADLDPGTDLDFLDFLEAIKPTIHYRHPHNPLHVPDHILASIIGPSVTIPFMNGKLQLGTWQRIVLVELNGPREREIIVTILFQ